MNLNDILNEETISTSRMACERNCIQMRVFAVQKKKKNAISAMAQQQCLSRDERPNFAWLSLRIQKNAAHQFNASTHDLLDDGDKIQMKIQNKFIFT